MYYLDGCYLAEGEKLDEILLKVNKSLIDNKISPVLYKLIKTDHPEAKLVLVKRSKFDDCKLRKIFD